MNYPTSPFASLCENFDNLRGKISNCEKISASLKTQRLNLPQKRPLTSNDRPVSLYLFQDLTLCTF